MRNTVQRVDGMSSSKDQQEQDKARVALGLKDLLLWDESRTDDLAIPPRKRISSPRASKFEPI
jgi:hypothetical protein